MRFSISFKMLVEKNYPTMHALNIEYIFLNPLCTLLVHLAAPNLVHLSYTLRLIYHERLSFCNFNSVCGIILVHSEKFSDKVFTRHD